VRIKLRTGVLTLYLVKKVTVLGKILLNPNVENFGCSKSQ
jgi:hypothetical protein